jgi:hypothetical protein
MASQWLDRLLGRSSGSHRRLYARKPQTDGSHLLILQDSKGRREVRHAPSPLEHKRGVEYHRRKDDTLAVDVIIEIDRKPLASAARDHEPAPARHDLQEQIDHLGTSAQIHRPNPRFVFDPMQEPLECSIWVGRRQASPASRQDLFSIAANLYDRASSPP